MGPDIGEMSSRIVALATDIAGLAVEAEHVRGRVLQDALATRRQGLDAQIAVGLILRYIIAFLHSLPLALSLCLKQ